jgi:DNA-binding NarL/FixJ family response regulator
MKTARKEKPTIILIDDHPGALVVAGEILQDEFEIVASVGDGDSGLNALSTFNPDIVILDIGMPGKDGFETAREIKERARTTRIVFLTAIEDVDYACAARDMGSSYVVKRRMRTDLLTAAREAMGDNLFFSPIRPT